ncbi:hypothetical protein PFICI_04829 [Pestalotiopsis fici W106-1]|uniref:Uncharacterized protein n=1 Tax=Pestalotiopsis fici (strain W106-1 / CGMCC3.15140) TaxID=1229662 RepID=W3XA15_PESFW|nr:uncharacterized protein PFICI_04829 [Pestalotiopsis fici W106-1]ETS82953.1 hypothetical protein PFICI_04829 [Pestalotiopsis fici W106-1]
MSHNTLWTLLENPWAFCTTYWNRGDFQGLVESVSFIKGTLPLEHNVWRQLSDYQIPRTINISGPLGIKTVEKILFDQPQLLTTLRDEIDSLDDMEIVYGPGSHSSKWNGLREYFRYRWLSRIPDSGIFYVEDHFPGDRFARETYPDQPDARLKHFDKIPELRVLIMLTVEQ